MEEVVDAGNTAGEVTSTSQPEVETGATVEKTEATTTSQPQGDTTEPPKKEGGVAKRIRELVAEREAWREMAMRSQGTSKEQEKKEVAQGKPESSKFESYEAYMEALTDWKVEQRLSERDQKAKETSSENERNERLQKLKEGFEERAEKFREQQEDFDDVAFSQFPVSPAMAEAIMESELGPQILFHLGNNPKEAMRIARMSPYAAAREIGKLEVTLPELVKPSSSAPAPINPVKPKSNASEAPSESDDMKSWIAKRQKQVHGR